MAQQFNNEIFDSSEGHENFNKQVFGDGFLSKGATSSPDVSLSQGPVGGSKFKAKPGNAQSPIAHESADTSSEDETAQLIGAGVLKYKSLIWRTADTLRGTGVKESDYPRFMAPFFALALVESRIKRLRAEKIDEYATVTGKAFDANDAADALWLQQNIQIEGYGFHPEVARLGVGLAELVKVKAANFYLQLQTYLKQFDPETRRLLGVDYVEGQPKFLDIKGVALDLSSRPNDPLFTFCAGSGDTPGWAGVDLVQFDNSEVTTLEEHIKRMWADISAETAGEQYTPKDLIALACALGIEARRANIDSTQICDVYDMACGGGNFVFAGEEALRKEFPGLSVRVRGQELNDALYALAALEARFRPDATIQWGNTLTHDHFLGSKFGFIVANPPYGVDWKAFATMIKASNCGRFSADRMPPTSDGQLLFLQHAVFHLDDNGVGAIVHSGSTLFSGDAGGGESETRRWLFQDQDVVEAIVQLPKNEFFNTGIATYLWILNKNKPADRKGKVLLINAETCFKKLKKNLNQKNCEIDLASRLRIIDCFKTFSNTDISKVMDVDDLLYNKVSLELHRHDENGRAIPMYGIAIDVASVRSVSLDGESWMINEEGMEPGIVQSVDQTAGGAKAYVDKFNACAKPASVLILHMLDGSVWTMDREEHRITEAKLSGDVVEHGIGVIAIKAKLGKSMGKESVRWDMAINPFVETDTETIQYSSDKSQSDKSKNEKLISDFIKRWVRDPSLIKAQSVGAEINFNRIFPKLIQIRPTLDILERLAEVDADLRDVEAEFLKAVHGDQQ